jgi:hypothetical protein
MMGLSMADLEMFFPDRSALKFTDEGVTEADWLNCDGCDKPQLVNGGIISDQVFVCAKCRVVD